CPDTEKIARRLDTRRLFKRALWTELDAVPGELLGADHEEIGSLEREIAEEANVDHGDVILDVPAKPQMKESSSRVLVNGGVRTLAEQSTLVTALEQAQRDQWRMGVYAPPESSERVGTAAVRELGLDLDGTRIRDVRTGINARLDEFDG
ncbi:MAG: HD superfamily phosphohydrolase, partial [Natronomonas sp.]